MDPRRLLTIIAASGHMSGCASAPTAASLSPEAPVIPSTPAIAVTPSPGSDDIRLVPEPHEGPVALGRSAIETANAEARQVSRADRFVGGVQVFEWRPGRIYEVWTAPMRVTTLTLTPGETIVSKAAGDTVRWQLAETTSGDGAAQQTHILIKPLERALETNMVLTTSRRVILIALRSGSANGFNAAVTWDVQSPLTERETPPAASGPVQTYVLKAVGRAPRWMPLAAFSDGRATHIVLPPNAGTTPVLIAKTPEGEDRLINYRQQGDVLSADQVLDEAELRLGGERPQIVRLTRPAEASR